jgi:beta-lactam-binding protein with PASTA domain
MTRLHIFLAGTKRALTFTLCGVALLAVAVFCAFLAMRLAIHGREVSVPNLEGKSDADAAAMTKSLGLNLSVENRFYSGAITPNHVLSQSPIAGARVRRGWQVRVTESLGGQKVSVPDVTGQTERPASLMLRRLQLELGTVAHLPAPGPAGVVLTQSPPPNSAGLNGPRVALLVSDDEAAASTVAYVMPSIVGMTLSAAQARLATVGLHIAGATNPDAAPAPADASDPNAPAPVPNATAQATEAAPVAASPTSFSVNATIVSQSPQPGHKVTRGDAIRVALAGQGQ